MAERLEVNNHSLIRADEQVPTTNQEVVESKYPGTLGELSSEPPLFNFPHLDMQNAQYLFGSEDDTTVPPATRGMAFRDYLGDIPEQLQFSSSHNSRVVDSDLFNTFLDGTYTYGQNNEQEARMAERLEAFNYSFLLSKAYEPKCSRDDQDGLLQPQDDLLHDGMIDPRSLSLPLFGEKVPCPECGRLLKDKKSMRFVVYSSDFEFS